MHKKRARPNLLVILTDQQRWDTVGDYGSPMGLTPHLDGMAQRGVRFEATITNQPVCAPSRACLLTGQYATSHGVWRNRLGISPTATTIAHSFKQAGYTVGYVGKWHLSPREKGVGPVPPEYRGGFVDFWEASNLLEFTSHPHEGSLYDTKGNEVRFSEVYRVDALTERVVRFLRDLRRDPFFLFVSYLEPHQQNDWKRFAAPEGYAERYRNPFVPQDLKFFPGDWQKELPDYYGCISRIDECLGTILQKLRELGLEENTIVAFLSDHGCHFRTRNPEYKRSAHESSIRIPFVVQGPGFNRSLVVPELVSMVDIAPTLLDAAGVPIPDSMQGRSAISLLERRADEWHNEAFIQISESMVGRALRTERWKYCVVSPEGHGGRDSASNRYVEYQLYDLFADPHELVNLAGRRESQEIVSQLRERLKAHMVETGEKEPQIREARFYP